MFENDNFLLEALAIKEADEINDYLNTHTGIVVAFQDLTLPVLKDVRTMTAQHLALTFGPFSMDFRIEMRKRKIEQLHSKPGAALFPVTTRMFRGKEVKTPYQGTFKAKAYFPALSFA